ncbi:Rid family hydrolase [Burkholderia alba]|uniref:Rid family hydrolase n=1 Tax=Burkholderia alba TaxID=2683677 RepID=UPI003898FB65
MVGYVRNVRVQTRSVLDQIRRTLDERGCAASDIVAVQVLFVADPANNGEPGFNGFSPVRLASFDSMAKPTPPTRTRAQVVGLSNPAGRLQ